VIAKLPRGCAYCIIKKIEQISRRENLLPNPYKLQKASFTKHTLYCTVYHHTALNSSYFLQILTCLKPDIFLAEPPKLTYTPKQAYSSFYQQSVYLCLVFSEQISSSFQIESNFFFRNGYIRSYLTKVSPGFQLRF